MHSFLDFKLLNYLVLFCSPVLNKVPETDQASINMINSIDEMLQELQKYFIFNF